MVVPTSRAVYQAREHLVQLVHRGVYPPGSRLPGERDLATMVAVSRSTLRQALDELETEGLVERQPQRGWFVTRRGVIGDQASSLQSFSDIVRRKGFTPTTTVLGVTTRGATFEEATRLDVAPASPIVDLYRLRGMDGNPICLDRALLIASRVPGLLDGELEDTSLYAALAERCGVVVFHASCELRATGADQRTAELLKVDQGSPVLHYRDVSRDQDERIVLSSEVVYRGDAYRFEADLYRRLAPS